MSSSVEDFQKMRQGGKTMTRVFMVLVVVAVAVWWQFIRLPQQVEITNMVPGLDLAGTRLECWLTLAFNDPPEGNIKDVKVVFQGEAIKGGSQRFDWDYIAANDYTAGAQRADNRQTSAGEAPPIGQTTKVRFVLDANERVEQASYSMPLVATVYWAGTKQDKMQRSAGHAYRHESSAL